MFFRLRPALDAPAGQKFTFSSEKNPVFRPAGPFRRPAGPWHSSGLWEARPARRGRRCDHGSRGHSPLTGGAEAYHAWPMSIPGAGERVSFFRRVARLPIGFGAVLLVVSCIVEEQYPFSVFPMYSDFPEEVHYLYVTNAADEPLALSPVFGRRTSELKKGFETRWDMYQGAWLDTLDRDDRKAARKAKRIGPDVAAKTSHDTLEWLRQSAPDQERARAAGALKLYLVQLTLDDNGAVRTSTTYMGGAE